MKLTEVVPLFKSGKSEIIGNYQPISLLMTISKILEKVVYNRVYKFLTDTWQIYECQYRFRSEHSCEHAIGQLVGYVIKNLEQRTDTIIGRERLIRSHSSARFCFKLSGNLN